MDVKIMPSKISGTVMAPPSKSYTHRSIIFAALAKGVSAIKNPLLSDDTLCTIDACRQLGAKIDIKKNAVKILGVNGKFPPQNKSIKIFCGLSGTTMRLISAISSLTQNRIIIDGEKRLRERPMKDLILALSNLGINITSQNNDFLLPLTVNGGKIRGGYFEISADLSSQFLSALLIISPFAQRDMTIKVTSLHSKPYVDITVDLMKTFGVNVEVEGKYYFIKSGQFYKCCSYNVEGDYTSASYFLVAEYVTGSKITIDNLKTKSVQGDKFFGEIFGKLKKNKLPEIKFDMGNYPDIVPTLAVAASCTNCTTIIENISHLRTKESDRITAVTRELRKMGIETWEKKDSLIIKGGKLESASIDTYNDHRIAMSFAVAGLVARGVTVIKNAQVVNKSYPDFWQDLKKIGADIEIIN